MSGVRFKVEKVFAIPGRGVVVTGRAEEGKIVVGQSVGFLDTNGQMNTATVMAIEVARRLVEETEGGQQASLLLEGVRKNQVAIGTILLEPPPSTPTDRPQQKETFEPPQRVQTSVPPEISASSPVPGGGAIQPSSGLWRAAIILLIGAFIILALLFFQGKWDPGKKFVSIQQTAEG